MGAETLSKPDRARGLLAGVHAGHLAGERRLAGTGTPRAEAAAHPTQPHPQPGSLPCGLAEPGSARPRSSARHAPPRAQAAVLKSFSSPRKLPMPLPYAFYHSGRSSPARVTSATVRAAPWLPAVAAVIADEARGSRVAAGASHRPC
jgi:hypothetical protein